MFFKHRWIRRAVKGPTTRGVWGHAPPENYEILVLWNAISSVLRGQILSKMFSKSIVLLCLFLLAWIRVEEVNYILYKLCGFWNCSGYHFQLSILCVVSLYEFIWKFQNNCRNLKFSYPERILIGIRDFRAKSEGPRRDQDD